MTGVIVFHVAAEKRRLKLVEPVCNRILNLMVWNVMTLQAVATRTSKLRDKPRRSNLSERNCCEEKKFWKSLMNQEFRRKTQKNSYYQTRSERLIVIHIEECLKLKAGLIGQQNVTKLFAQYFDLTKLVFIRGQSKQRANKCVTFSYSCPISIAFNFKCYFVLLIYDHIRLSLAAVCPSGPCKNCSHNIYRRI